MAKKQLAEHVRVEQMILKGLMPYVKEDNMRVREVLRKYLPHPELIFLPDSRLPISRQRAMRENWRARKTRMKFTNPEVEREIAENEAAVARHARGNPESVEAKMRVFGDMYQPKQGVSREALEAMWEEAKNHARGDRLHEVIHTSQRIGRELTKDEVDAIRKKHPLPPPPPELLEMMKKDELSKPVEKTIEEHWQED